MTNQPPPPPPWGDPSRQPAGSSWAQPSPGPPPATGLGGGAPGGVPPAPPAGPVGVAAPTPLSSAARTWGWLAVAVAAVIGVAAFLVWAEFPELGIEVKGIGGDDAGSGDETRDGVLTLTLAIGAGVLGVIRGFGRWALGAAITAVVCGALSAVIALADIGDISDTEDTFGVAVDVGVGLWLTLVGGLALLAVGIVGIVKRR